MSRRNLVVFVDWDQRTDEPAYTALDVTRVKAHPVVRTLYPELVKEGVLTEDEVNQPVETRSADESALANAQTQVTTSIPSPHQS